jgi:hypothetical protein
MATQNDYTTAANAILAILNAYVKADVPDVFGEQEKALAAMPGIAGQCAKAAVDAVDAERAQTSTTQEPQS